MRLDLRTRPSPPQVPHGVDCSPVPMHSWQSVTCSRDTAQGERRNLRGFASVTKVHSRLNAA